LDRLNYTDEQKFNAGLSKSPPGVRGAPALSLSGFATMHCVLRTLLGDFIAFCKNERFLAMVNPEIRSFMARLAGRQD
jgi:hypothetical protein